MNNLKKRITCLVPKKMLPNKETFLNLGFEFEDTHNDFFCVATLPENWLSVNDNGSILFIDEKEHKRATLNYDAEFSFLGLF